MKKETVQECSLPCVMFLEATDEEERERKAGTGLSKILLEAEKSFLDQRTHDGRRKGCRTFSITVIIMVMIFSLHTAEQFLIF